MMTRNLVQWLYNNILLILLLFKQTDFISIKCILRQKIVILY